MIELTQTGLVAALSAGFTTGAHWALRYYLGSKNGNGTRAMKEWQDQKNREVTAVQVAMQANATAIAALNSTIEHGVIPRLELLERK